MCPASLPVGLQSLGLQVREDRNVKPFTSHPEKFREGRQTNWAGGFFCFFFITCGIYAFKWEGGKEGRFLTPSVKGGEHQLQLWSASNIDFKGSWCIRSSHSIDTELGVRRLRSGPPWLTLSRSNLLSGAHFLH